MERKDEQQKAIILEIPMARLTGSYPGSEPILHFAKDGAPTKDGASTNLGATGSGVMAQAPPYPITPKPGRAGDSPPPVRPAEGGWATHGASSRARCAAVRGDGRQCVFPAKDGYEKCERHQR